MSSSKSKVDQHSGTAAADAHQPWEDAYNRFETSDEEVRKFIRRLRQLGLADLPRDSKIVELFCGRGNGLEAWAQLGFAHLEGIDLSPTLLSQYRGPGRCYVGDCRYLPFPDSSKDLLIVQGGLHHLSVLPDDLEQVLSEAKRVLHKGGLLVIVEPWLTPFLRVVHFACRLSLARHVYARLDALATMIQYERETYEHWLNQPELVATVLKKYFEPRQVSIGWGKYSFVGIPRREVSAVS